MRIPRFSMIRAVPFLGGLFRALGHKVTKFERKQPCRKKKQANRSSIRLPSVFIAEADTLANKDCRTHSRSFAPTTRKSGHSRVSVFGPRLAGTWWPAARRARHRGSKRLDNAAGSTWSVWHPTDRLAIENARRLRPKPLLRKWFSQEVVLTVRRSLPIASQPNRLKPCIA